MTKKQKYCIVANLENTFRVEERNTGIICFQGGTGKEGLEDCEDWLAKQPEED